MCCRCKTQKSESEFYIIKVKGVDRLSTYCKPCAISQKMERINAVRSIVKEGKTCVHCGYGTYSGALEFHHVDSLSKEAEISKLIVSTSKNNLKRLIVELKKCVILCRNHHAEVHAGILILPVDILTTNPAITGEEELSYKLSNLRDVFREKREMKCERIKKLEDEQTRIDGQLAEFVRSDRSRGVWSRAAKKFGVSHSAIFRRASRLKLKLVPAAGIPPTTHP